MASKRIEPYHLVNPSWVDNEFNWDKKTTALKRALTRITTATAAVSSSASTTLPSTVKAKSAEGCYETDINNILMQRLCKLTTPEAIAERIKVYEPHINNKEIDLESLLVNLFQKDKSKGGTIQTLLAIICMTTGVSVSASYYNKSSATEKKKKRKTTITTTKSKLPSSSSKKRKQSNGGGGGDDDDDGGEDEAIEDNTYDDDEDREDENFKPGDDDDDDDEREEERESASRGNGKVSIFT